MEVGCNRLARSIGAECNTCSEVLWLNADGTQEQKRLNMQNDSECGLAISKMFDISPDHVMNFMYGYWKILDNIVYHYRPGGVSLLFDAMMPKPSRDQLGDKRWYEDFIELHRANHEALEVLYELDNYYTWGVMMSIDGYKKSERPFMNFVNGGNGLKMRKSHLPLLKQFDLIFEDFVNELKESHPNLRHHMYTTDIGEIHWTGGEPLLAQRKIGEDTSREFQREEILSILEKNLATSKCNLDCSFCGGAYYMDNQVESRISSELYDKPSILSVEILYSPLIIFKNILEQPAMTAKF
ncbi:hypothetical protein SPFM6_00117 [Salmonella phage SPFM6]|nr:hypothetical protein SPFM6_00117 [Salmonella phage SPFM6]